MIRLLAPFGFFVLLLIPLWFSFVLFLTMLGVGALYIIFRGLRAYARRILHRHPASAYSRKSEAEGVTIEGEFVRMDVHPQALPREPESR